MNNVKERLRLLNLSLLEKADVCLSGGAVCDFPPVMYKPFQTFGVGLIVCVHGSFTFSVAADVYEVKQGETVFLSEDTVFWILNVSDDLEVQILFYNVESIRDFLGNLVQQVQLYVKMSPEVYYVWRTNQEEDLISYMNLLESTTQAEGNRLLSNEKRLLLISLTYRLCSIFQQKFFSQKAVSQRSTEIFLQLISLIDRYYMTERQVSFYADKLCLSPKYLSELSSSVCGYTVHELIFKTIIRGAMSMLTGSSKTVQEIAAEFHFPNPSSFGTFFRKQTGISPQKFRVMNLQR